MKYYISKTIEGSFDSVLENVTETLKNEGFGVLSRIDIHEKLKEKLDVDFRKYVILGACNPPYAYEALKVESKIGTMLPCNVILQEAGDGKVEVSAIDPVASMQAVQNDKLGDIAEEIRGKLENAIAAL
mgnify:CR=1 FL=1